MDETFDAYRKWLGIPPEEQPPHHYRLLGIRVFEEDPDVIINAADRQMAHVRTFQGGANSDASQRLLNELAAARLTLLDPVKRAPYDVALRADLAQKCADLLAKLAPPPPMPPMGHFTGPSFGFYLKAAGRYAVVQFRRVWLNETMLPQAYRSLGKEVAGQGSYPGPLHPFREQLHLLAERLRELTLPDAEEPSPGFGPAVKRFFKNLRRRWDGFVIATKQKAALTQVGKVAFDHFGMTAGPPMITTKIKATLDQLAALRAESQQLSEVPAGQLLSGKRLALIILAIAAGFILLLMYLRWLLR